MALTPADVHNVAFSRPRIGKRGYDEQEVDLFIDLVEQELLRRIAEDIRLRNLYAELRDRDGGLQQREAGLAEWEAQLVEREAQLARRGAVLPQQVAQLRHREAQVAQREAQLAQHAARLARLEAELGQRLGQQQAVASCGGADATTNQVARPHQHPPQLSRALSKSAGTSRLEETRAVASVHGRHDMERMAIRAVTDVLGNTVTETVHERTRRGPVDNGRSAVVPDQSAELDQLKQQNAELARSLALIKSAAAVLAAALDRP